MRRAERCVYLCTGAALTSLLLPWTPTWTRLGLHPEWPSLAVLVLIAVIANVSAVQRLRVVAQNLRLRNPSTALPGQEPALQR
jgi:hypothetical protein